MLALEKRMRGRLERERSIIRGDLEQLRREARAEDLDVGGDNTPLTEAIDQVQAGLDKEARAERMGRLLVRLAALDDALARLRRGEYGWCTVCGRSLSGKRLDAMPEASMCVACKRESERGEQARGGETGKAARVPPEEGEAGRES